MAMIDVVGLRKEYRGTPVVDGVSFSVEEGEIFGILGPNGAGKTTTVECLEGLRSPDGGTVRVAGLDPLADNDQVPLVLGVQLQESQLQAKLLVREALELYQAFYPNPAPWEPLAERLGLTDLLENRFATLSGGQKQRLFVALALIGQPRAVVLDELTTGLDPRGRRDTWALIEEIRDSGVTVVLVTHFMEEAQRLCDRVAVFRSGRIVALDSPEQLIQRAAGSTVLSFTPSEPIPREELEALPGVLKVSLTDDRVTLDGDDDTVNALVGMVAARGVRAHRLRISDASLDQAFLELTGPDDVPAGSSAPAEGGDRA